MDLKKKDSENRILKKFVSRESLGKIITWIEASETPDFILKTLNGRISVELTNVMNPNLKQMEAAQDRIVDDAFKQFKERNTDILQVYIDFSSKPLSFDNRFLNFLSNDLCEFVERICLNNKGLEFHITTLDWPPVHEYFRTISICNTSNFENWQPYGAFLVPYVKEDWFKSRILSKEQKIPKYTEIFDENWLILNCEFGHESTAFRFEQLNLNYQSSQFDKIYIYQYFSDTITTLK